MRRNGLTSLIVIVILALGGLAATLVAGNEPLLGLDLQGGVSVVLQPVGETNDDSMDQAVSIIRQRVDGLGVAEPEISRQGDAIVVQLPGIDDRDRAIELVGQTAELRFRPVLRQQETGISVELLEQVTTTTAAPTSTTPDDPVDGSTTVPPTTAATETTTTLPGDEEGVAGVVGLPSQDQTTTAPTTTAPTTTAAPADGSTTTSTPIEDLPPEEQLALYDQIFGAITPAADDKAGVRVVLPEYDDDGNEIARYTLAPVPGAENPDDPETLPLTGEILSTARAELSGADGTWAVAVEARSGEDGIDRFNQISAQCFQAAQNCPTGQLAITLDGRVISAPRIQVPSFERDQISITGAFNEREAKDLALALRYGSLPVVLETQSVQAVSATLGQDALDAGVVAGLIGLALVFLYMVLYYRLLGLVAMLSLGVAGCLLWIVVAYLGESQGLALTLAGVTGIIVSVGVAVDSNVVFYEHLKEDVSRGRTLRTAVDSAFSSAFSTIVKADIPSLIGAAVLYWLTVGPVRGFALFLGLSTLFDLIVSYFFMRPATILLVRAKRMEGRQRWFGMPKPPDEEAAMSTGGLA